MFNQVVSQYKEPWLHMQMFGNLPAVQNDTQMLPQIIDTAASMGADRDNVRFLLPAANRNFPGFKKIVPLNTSANRSKILSADGMYTSDANAAIGIATGDCQMIFAKNLATNMLVVAHGGKPAMRCWDEKGTYEANIVDRVLEKLNVAAFASCIRIHIAGTIAAQKYRHEQPSSSQDRDLFLQHYGSDVFWGDTIDEGYLDLVAMTRITAARHKLTPGQVTHDGIDTVSHPSLVSYRQNGTRRRNIGIAVNLHPH